MLLITFIYCINCSWRIEHQYETIRDKYLTDEKIITPEKEFEDFFRKKFTKIYIKNKREHCQFPFELRGIINEKQNERENEQTSRQEINNENSFTSQVTDMNNNDMQGSFIHEDFASLPEELPDLGDVSSYLDVQN
ncbi:hypothetical protein NGRA_2720 [Nosema granulosis]|uniref:Uncharacterized protein n=1 Tax=Nosema granulosis TaxID=83296 RepID=A0A9P6GW40_9MICR|nr:hypothetical protein NGRA_2720 [Nosema granulosis]